MSSTKASSSSAVKWGLATALVGALAAVAYGRVRRQFKRKALKAAGAGAGDAKVAFAPFATSAPGKIILSGEHAVVHGALAVATTVERRSFVFFSPPTPGVAAEEQSIEIEIDHPQQRHSVVLPRAAFAAIAAAVAALPDVKADAAQLTPAMWEAVSAAVQKEYPKPTEQSHAAAMMWQSVIVVLVVWVTTLRASTGMRVLIQSELPMGAGLGSSASFGAAVAAGFYRLRNHFAGAAVSSDTIESAAATAAAASAATATTKSGGSAGTSAADTKSDQKSKSSSSSSSASSKPRFTGAGAPAAAELSKAEREVINGWAYQCECIIHGKPSGVDNTCVVYGGVVVYRNTPDGGKTFRFLKQLSGLRLFVTNTRVSRSTKDLVAGVKMLKDTTTCAGKSIEIIHAQSELLVSLVERLQSGDPTMTAPQLALELEVMFPLLEGALKGLRVGHAAIDSVVSAAQSFKLPASKLTGAGGGGSVITVIPPSASAADCSGFQAAMTAANRDCFEALVGQAGLLIHPTATQDDITVYLA